MARTILPVGNPPPSAAAATRFALRAAGWAIACVAVILAAAPTITGNGMPVASAAACPNIEVVFARGTDEPPGLGRVGQALVDDLRPQVKGRTVHAYAVNYPASLDFLQVGEGANDASVHVQATAVNCPRTEIVLGGYSQGAAIVDVLTTAPVAGLGFAAPMPAAVAGHVAAVAVFGNPSARVGQPLTTLSPLYGAKAIDLCNTNDPICSSGSNVNAHSLYPESGLVKQAATFVANRV